MRRPVHRKPTNRKVFDTGPLLLGLILFGPLLLTTFIAKLGVPFGPREVPASLYLMLGLMVLGLISSRLVFDIKRLAFFLLAVVILGGIQVYRGTEWSPTSFFMMVGIYACYTMTIVDQRFDVRRAISFFLNICTFIAICGIAQYPLQFIIGPTLAFPIDFLVPKSVLVEGYMNLNVLSYGSSTYKPNGVFLLEASFFSQLLAIAVITELCSHNRPWRLGIYLAGMLLSFSGTGIVILLLTMPVLIITQRRYDLIFLGILGVIVALLFYKQLNIGYFLERATEFNNVESSFFMRFVGGFYFFEQFLWTDQLRALFGTGAGTFMSFEERANLPVHESALNKIVFEFGIIGAIVNFSFLFYCLKRSTAPFEIKWACAVMFFMAGIYTPSSHGITLSLLLWPAAVSTRIVPEQRSESILRWLGLDLGRAKRNRATRSGAVAKQTKKRSPNSRRRTARQNRQHPSSRPEPALDPK